MKKMVSVLVLVCMLTSMLLFTSCSKVSDLLSGDKSKAPGGSYAPDMDGFASSGEESYVPDADMGESGTDDTSKGDESVEEKPNDSARLPSGMITACAWDDNAFYTDWLALFSQDNSKKGKFYNFTNPDKSWGYNSANRVQVLVKSAEDPVAGARVVASDEQGNTLFCAVTDARGYAYLFPDAINGNITVMSAEETVMSAFTADDRSLTVDLTDKGNKLNVIEIMLVVDVTGSMSDEIDFLKAELADVVDRIAANDSETVIKLAMLFYRDTDDAVPFDYYDFTDVTTQAGLFAQQEAINGQSARGGGDYPEAVDDALDMAVNKQWSTGATTKIIFHVLDAPAHDKTEHKQKLKNAVNTAAEKGIRICPIICSGAAEVTEYTMREAAIYTGGTFIFVTDDSGIGGSHHDPDIPNATVELLNSMMVRLVKGYHTGEFEAPIYWKQDPNLGA